MGVLDKIEGKLVVSCQALEDEPLHGADIMAKMARAAKIGGAAGIRANGPEDIRAIQEEVELPLIGIEKNMDYDAEVYITPTMREVTRVVRAGADIVAVDATKCSRPSGQSLREFIDEIKSSFDIPVMGDISVLKEGIQAEQAGFDLVGTTLSGYTEYSPDKAGPDFELLEELLNELSIPVLMEGRVSCPEQVGRAVNMGAHAVVVGSAITRPRKITARFVEGLKK